MKKLLKKAISIIISIAIIASTLAFNITGYANNTINILSQPENAAANLNDTIYFTVEAQGVGLNYIWECSTDNGVSWKGSRLQGYKTKKLTVPVMAHIFSTIYRCKITDSNNNELYTNTCAVYSKNQLAIVNQPKTVYANIGDSAVFQVVATGGGLSYQWQYSSDNGKTYANTTFSGRKTNTLTVPVLARLFNYKYRCIVTDSNNNSIISDGAGLYEKKTTYLQIVNQPENTTANIGDTISLNCQVIGDGLSYQWQYSSDNGKNWINSRLYGYNKSTVQVPVLSHIYNNIYRVIVTDNNSNQVVSTTAKISPKYDNLFVLSNDDNDDSYSAGHILLADYQQLTKDIKYLDKGISLTTSCQVSSTDLVMLKLTAKSNTKNGKLKFTVNSNITANYPVYTEKADYYIPVTSTTEIESIKIELTDDSQNIFISDIQLVNFEGSSIKNIKSGIHVKENTNVQYSLSDSFGDASSACTADDNYLYSVSKGVLSIYSINNSDTPSKVSQLSGLGMCHDISLMPSGNALVINSRENGTYFVDISNPLNPILASKYSTLEMATGLAVYGDYVFLCSRYFGVEIIDAADIYNPTYYSQVSNREEFYDCSVYNGYLYIGVWGQKNVKIYNLENLRNPVFVKTIALDGNAGGIVAENGILYASTGYHSRDNSTSLTSTGFGMGNGLEIYDIRNPESPKLLSISKIDGRYKYAGNDYWKVKLSGKYAILASTYCGVYIFDVTNLSAPKRVGILNVSVDKSSPSFSSYINGSFIFNFDYLNYNHEPIVSIATSKDKLYFGDVYYGIYQYDLKGADNEILYSDDLSYSQREKLSAPSTNNYNSVILDVEGSTYKAKAFGSYIYVAGSKGITTFDNCLNKISFYKTDFAVKDLIISSDGEYIYSAECENGVGIYKNENGILTKISSTAKNSIYNFTVTSLQETADDNLILAQAGFTRYAYVNVNNKNNPTITLTTGSGTMYYRNLCNGIIDGKYSAVCDSGKISLHSVNASGNLTLSRQISNNISVETNGMAAYNDKIIAISNNGYIYFNPLTQTTALSTITPTKISGVNLRGKPTVHGDIMVVSYCYGKEIMIINIADIESPVLIEHIKINASIDVASVYDDYILVPIRNDGLLVLKSKV